MNTLAQRQYLVQTFKEHTQQLVAKQRTKDAKAARRQLQQERVQVWILLLNRRLIGRAG